MMDEDEIKSYKEFMYNPNNAFNCENCPDNKDMGNNEKLPCGQWKCWVIGSDK